MLAISQWLHQLGFLIFLAGMSEIVLPNSSVRKMARLFIGLIVILSIIEPLVDMLVHPDWIDGLFPDVLQVESEPFVRAGVDMATSVTTQAEKVWMGQAAQQLSALITLVDGIVDADVSLYSVSDDGPWGAEVTLWAAKEFLDDQDLQAEKGREIARMLDKLMQPGGLADVQLIWEQTTTHR